MTITKPDPNMVFIQFDRLAVPLAFARMKRCTQGRVGRMVVQSG